MIEYDLSNINTMFSVFKKNLFESKKYWIIYVILVVLASLSLMTFDNLNHPKMELIAIILFVLLGIFLIAFYNGHNDKELYKSAFIIILSVGIICSFLTPICFTPDEVEHFVRSEITSQGDFFPVMENNSFSTIQSVFDLIENGKYINNDKYEGMLLDDSSIFKTDADTQPINYTSVEHHSAFVQNPFWGYLAQAFGIFLAKLFNLNSIWLLWLGRIFNTLLYASLVALAVKKTPILKIPIMIFACMPLSIYLCASLSIDAFINGMGILVISYFFYLYKSPKNSLTKLNLVKISILVLLLGTCKVTYFSLILLVLCIPRSNFKDKDYYFGFLFLMFTVIFAVLWSKFYVDPGFFKSWRVQYTINAHANSTEQINYILSHKKETLLEIFHIPNHFNDDLMFSYNNTFLLWDNFRSIYLMFLGAVVFLYPKDKFNIKSRIGTLFTCFVIYFGTYITFLITWNSVGSLGEFGGIQPRYFLPMLALLPFTFGFNNVKNVQNEIDHYLIIGMLFFLVMMPICMVITVY